MVSKKAIKINPLNEEECPQQFIIEMTQEEDKNQNKMIEMHQTAEDSQLNNDRVINEYESEQLNNDSQDNSQIQKNIYQQHAKNSTEALQQAQDFCDQQDYETAVKVISDFLADAEENKIAEKLNSEELFDLHKTLAEYYKKCNKYVQSLQEFEKALKNIHSEATYIRTSKSSEEHCNIRQILCKFSNNI